MAAATAVIATTMPLSAMNQDVDGKVIDENGQPLPNVNVVLLAPDSTFVQGAVTDDQGMFKIISSENGSLLKVTSISYETRFIPLTPSTSSLLTIQMKEDTEMLDEVVVKSQLPKTLVKGDAMRTTVAGTILEKAGTVSDALSKIPSLEAERNGGVKVLGRGDAEVYINGRRVQDMNELSRLRSDQIQHVEVVQNPGARYAASTKAVVRITLKKAQGEGISFQDNLGGIYQYGHTLTNNLDVNYRTGGLDITASFWAGRYGHSKGLQDNDMYYLCGDEVYEGFTKQETKNVWKGWSPQLQINYMVNENHSFGAFYKYDRHPSGELTSDFNTDNYKNGCYIERSESSIKQTDNFIKHIFNVYYNGKVGLLGIDFNLDGLFDDTNDEGSTYETMTPVGDYLDGSMYDSPTKRSIESNTSSANNFWASKLILSYPILKGNFSLGGEYSYNHRTDAYSYMASDYVPVKATDTEINEKSSAIFMEYGRPFGKVFAQVGLRYEHLTNDYFDFGKRQDEVCRNYGDWFPAAVITAPIGKVQVSLSYRRDIQRPNYSNLSSSTIYLNRYSFQSGNPYLKPTYTHSLVLNTGYKWANLTLNYGRIKDIVTMFTEPFPGSEDPLISLVHPINSEEDFDHLSIGFSASPTIGCWHPIWYAFCVFQNYKTPTADGSMLKLDRPYLTLVWQNTIELHHGYRLNASMQWANQGDYNNFRIIANRFDTSLGIQRDIDLHRLGSLTVDLRCSDIFNTNKTDAILYGPRELTVRNPARRTFMLDLTWKFNEARSKYRGSGAGEKQKARM
ncbi:MAG: TonB-dependent receptor [Bacteroidales bacterium]|nr:TonB-dependent receptor [Bacteroidales bacterium]